MRFNPDIHTVPHLVKALLGRLEGLAGFDYPANEMVVLNYHSTPEKFIPNFIEQVEFLQRHFTIISPDDLRRFYSADNAPAKTCSLLFTFDDGLKNNLYALQELEKRNIRAFLFVVPGFINCDRGEQTAFYKKNIRPVINTHIDAKAEDTTALSWDELRALQAAGHSIGCHTLTHTLDSSNSTPENSEAEIIESKIIIELELGQPVDSFCSINNTLQSVGKTEKELIGKNYRFHFTTLPGLNATDKDPLFIRRRNVEAHWLKGAVYFAIGTRDLGRWQEKISSYKAI